MGFFPSHRTGPDVLTVADSKKRFHIAELQHISFFNSGIFIILISVEQLHEDTQFIEIHLIQGFTRRRAARKPVGKKAPLVVLRFIAKDVP